MTALSNMASTPVCPTLLPADVYMGLLLALLSAILGIKWRKLGRLAGLHMERINTGNGSWFNLFLKTKNKCHLSEENCHFLPLLLGVAVKEFWDGYRDHQSVVIDEFRGRVDISHLLRWFDRYPVLVEIKGSATPLLAQRIYVTSNLDPRVWYPDLDESTQAALMRRLQVTYCPLALY